MIDLGSIAGPIEYDHTPVAYRPSVRRDHQQRGLKPANVLSGRAGVGARDSDRPVPLGPLRCLTATKFLTNPRRRCATRGCIAAVPTSRVTLRPLTWDNEPCDPSAPP
jgi:hypothetical protein